MIQIKLTDEQIAQMKPLFDQLYTLLESGTSGVIIAQPYRPGYLNVTVLSQEQGEAIQEITLRSEVIAHDRRQLDITRRQAIANARTR